MILVDWFHLSTSSISIINDIREIAKPKETPQRHSATQRTWLLQEPMLRQFWRCCKRGQAQRAQRSKCEKNANFLRLRGLEPGVFSVRRLTFRGPPHIPPGSVL